MRVFAFSLVVLVVIIGGMVVLVIRDHAEEESGEPKDGSVATTADRQPQRPRSGSVERQEERVRESGRRELMNQLEAALERRDSHRLIALVPELEAAGLLTDPDVFKRYWNAIGTFSVDELVRLSNVWPSMHGSRTIHGSIFNAVARNLRDKNDAGSVFTFLGGIPRDHPFRGDILFKAAQDMTMFDPANIAMHYPRFSSQERERIALGLKTRVAKIAPLDEKLELIIAYVDSVPDAELAGPMLENHLMLTAKNNPLESLEWVRQQDPELRSQLDEPIIRALVESHPLEAARYLDEIRAAGDESRSQAALEIMVKEYAGHNPRAALDWVLGLPDGVRVTEQMIADPFVELAKSDPDAAAEVMKQMEDPGVSELLHRLWPLVNKAE